jgi:signal transduction histidine kinase/integral membrane sensor domain MASE1
MKASMSRKIFNTLCIATGYAVGAQLGFLLALLPQWSITLLWPPSGVALAAVLLAGRTVLPGIFLGALVTSLTQLPFPITPLMLCVAMAISAASTLSALAAGEMLKHIAPNVPYGASAGELVKGCLAIGLACAIAASGGAGSLYFSGLVPEDLARVSWGLWWLGDFCGMLIFGPVAWVAARLWKEHRNEFSSGPIIPAILLNSTFAAVAVLAFMMLWNSETDQVSKSLAREATNAANSVTKALLAAERDIEAIRALLYASEYVSADEFRRYTSPEFGNRNIDSGAQGVEWAPRVTDLKTWEALEGIRLYEFDHSGKRIPVAQRDEYFPVHFVEPGKGVNERVIGFDLGSEKLRRAALERARDTGTLSMVAPIALVQLAQSEPAMLIAVPVYRPDLTIETVAVRRANLTGFACGVYRIGQVFNEAVNAHDDDVDLHLFDEALSAGSQWYHTKASSYRSRVGSTAPAPTLASLLEGLHGTARISFADHNWLVVVTPGPSYVQVHRTWIPWGVSMLLVALGIALSSFLLERIAAHKNIEDERQKTENALLDALAANESKSYFMAAASHDIKQPLFALGMLTDTLLMTNKTESIVPILRGLRSSIEQMSQHFDFLMDVGRFHGGKFEVIPAKFRLGQFSARIDLEIAPLCAAKGLTWNLDMDDVLVFTDQDLLLRLMRNLLTNAVRFTESGEVCCRAKAYVDRVEFLISDTGSGIPEEQQKQVFEQYVRLAHSGITSAGSGLGLSIVRKISEALELGIQMSSVVGKGTVFRFQLPRIPEH